MKIKWVLFVLHSALYYVYGQDTACTASGDQIGTCKPISECPDLQKMVHMFTIATEDVRENIRSELTKRRCEGGGEIKVCCTHCLTPDNKDGVVKHLRQCPHLLSMVTQRTTAGVEYVRQSRVSPTSLNVCCGPSPSAPPSAEYCNSLIESPPDPSSKCCGLDMTAGSRIIGGQTTSIGEYPWSVLLEYNINGKLSTRCGGTLISNRHVITAAHCITGGNAKPPVNVIVGEFDTSNQGPDCVFLPDGTSDCTAGAISVPVESSIAHPEYSTITNQNDIAIIKLKSPVTYSNFVRPICLPSSEVIRKTQFVVTGWGRVNNTQSKSPRKQAVQIDQFNFGECQKIYRNLTQIWEKQICAGGDPGKDSCSGDSGGPLMAQMESGASHFALAGVVSFGPRRCGTYGVPGVYTNVLQYIEWIWQNLG